jgi:uncharacterized membrane protein
MEFYSLIKTVHIISATILFGTGLGIAFFMLRSLFTDNVNEKLYAAKTTVLADYFFTFPAAIIQPLTGVWLVWQAGFDWASTWLVATYIIYAVAALCWLPVVYLQIQMKSILVYCAENNTTIPARYYTLFKYWFILGWPAFIGLVVVFFLMVIKPL